MKERHWTGLVRPENLDIHRQGNAATVVVEPLERGFGVTLGNALRRAMLSSLPGWSVVAARIDGASQSHDRIAGVRESLGEVLLNLKGIAMRGEAEGLVHATVCAAGGGPVTAAGIRLPDGLDLVDPDHRICTPEEAATFRADLVFAFGRGYVPAAAHAASMVPEGFMALDSLFSPVRQVSWTVETTRLGQVLDYDRLVLLVETDGTVGSDEALGFAARTLHGQLAAFVNFEDAPPRQAPVERDPLGFSPVLLRPVEELELSVRASNCMRHENVLHIGDLVTRSEAQLLRVPNFGRKSLNKIKAALAGLGLSLGMQVPGWPPENVEALARRYANVL